MRILVVDDDAEIAGLIRDVGKAEGHEVQVVVRGSEAIQASLNEDFDLLITDLMLPDLHGVELVRALKAQAPQMPVIVVSALDPREHDDVVGEAGASCFLQKPLRISQLREEIRMAAMARAALQVVLIDPDPIHRIRVTKTLEALGCTVRSFGTTGEVNPPLDVESPSLVMIDTTVPDILAQLEQCVTHKVPAFVYAEEAEGGSEDRYMRAGASLFLTKPIDTNALLTQAQFLANF